MNCENALVISFTSKHDFQLSMGSVPGTVHSRVYNSKHPSSLDTDSLRNTVSHAASRMSVVDTYRKLQLQTRSRRMINDSIDVL